MIVICIYLFILHPVIVICIYLFISHPVIIICIYLFISELAEDDTDWNPWGEEFDNEQPVMSHHEPPKILWNLEPAKDKEPGYWGNNSTGMFHIEIWGKAAIGKIKGKIHVLLVFFCC